jgi:hypothetical protein
MEAKFADVLEAAESLPVDEKEMLVDIMRHRLTDERRKILKAEIEDARRDFALGNIVPASIDEIMGEILS